MSNGTTSKRQAFTILIILTFLLSGCFKTAMPSEKKPDFQPPQIDSINDILILDDKWIIDDMREYWGAVVDFSNFNKMPRNCEFSYDIKGQSPIARNVMVIVVEDTQGVGQIFNDGPGSNIDSLNAGLAVQGESQHLNYSAPIQWHLNKTIPLSSPSEKPISLVVIAIRDINGTGSNLTSQMVVNCDGDTAGFQAYPANGIDWFDLSDNSSGAGAWADFTTGRSGAGLGSLYQNSTKYFGFLGIKVDGDILTVHGAAGRIIVSHPGGTDEWIVRPRQTSVEGAANPWRSYSFGPGPYSATFDFVNVYPSATVTGIWLTWSPPAGP